MRDNWGMTFYQSQSSTWIKIHLMNVTFYSFCLCSYSGTGLQAVLELYFAPFLYVCSGISRAKKLSTTSVNIYIALYQLCALSAGFLADKIFGEF
jgi:hypothetical protein